MASVSMNNIRKSYGTTEVLHGIDVDIADGEFIVLVGPSGCGKSTLLRMIAGLEDITSGELKIDERVVNDVEPKGRDIAMVFQNYALYPHMTVAENMAFSMRLRGAGRSEKDAAVREAADILGLGQLLDRYPKQLSGGQRQRVAMGRAIVRKPQVFLFDEPLSNLDAKLRVQMRAELKELHQRLGTTMIYVTHDQIEAMTMADKIVVLQGGEVEQVGPPLQLYDRPDNIFVAEFIGSPSMNLIPGKIEGGRFHAAGLFDLELPGRDLPEGREVMLGLRPEDLHPDPDGIAAEVTLVEPTGSEMQVSMRIGAQEIIALFRERISAAPGGTVRFRTTPERLHLFDTETGNRLPA